MKANGRKFPKHFNMRINEKDTLVPPNAFGCVDLHPCLAQDNVAVVMHHKDVVGLSSLAGFYCVTGISYNFIVDHGDYPWAPAFFDHGSANYKEFAEYCNTMRNDPILQEDLLSVERYMKAFLRACKNGDRVLIFCLTPGRSLIFNAEETLHGAIVPRNTTRCLAIFYWLSGRVQSLTQMAITTHYNLKEFM